MWGASCVSCTQTLCLDLRRAALGARPRVRRASCPPQPRGPEGGGGGAVLSGQDDPYTDTRVRSRSRQRATAVFVMQWHQDEKQLRLETKRELRGVRRNPRRAAVGNQPKRAERGRAKTVGTGELKGTGGKASREEDRVVGKGRLGRPSGPHTRLHTAAGPAQ